MKDHGFSGRGYPLGIDNVDTDMIIAASHLKTLSRLGLGRHAFAALRGTGSVFDDPHYRGASILIAGQNFGCGSSREHAVWAIMDFGVRAVIAGGYSDIFAGNALKNGLLTISLGSASLARVMAHARQGAIVIDLNGRMIGLGEFQLPFAMDSAQVDQISSGADEINMTLKHDRDIAEFEQRLPNWHVSGAFLK